MEMKPAGSWSPIGPADPTTGRGTALPSKYESDKLMASTKDTVPARLTSTMRAAQLQPAPTVRRASFSPIYRPAGFYR